jgi:hypothetical protein
VGIMKHCLHVMVHVVGVYVFPCGKELVHVAFHSAIFFLEVLHTLEEGGGFNNKETRIEN